MGQTLKANHNEQLPKGYKDPSEWTYREVSEYLQKKFYPKEIEAKLGEVHGKLTISVKVLVFSGAGGVTGCDIGQLRSLQVTDRESSRLVSASRES